ncbi:MAG: hypothetical protein UR98_C0030G0005 [Parcubacteria group bacterium GW2011_GWA1_36_12]|nr:MAG: hypothetical protein UR98_C0030G0005 [Parcubacteria group bacterium GW2011_GWA1_36_12]
MMVERNTLNAQSSLLHQQIHEAISFGRAAHGTVFSIDVPDDVMAVYAGISREDLTTLRKRHLSIVITASENFHNHMQIAVIGQVREKFNLHLAMRSPKERHKILLNWYKEVYSAIQNPDNDEFNAHTHEVLEETRLMLGFSQLPSTGKRILGMFDLQFSINMSVNSHLKSMKSLLDNYLQSEENDFDHIGAIDRNDAGQLLQIIWDLMEINQPGSQQRFANIASDRAFGSISDGSVSII